MYGIIVLNDKPLRLFRMLLCEAMSPNTTNSQGVPRKDFYFINTVIQNYSLN